MQHGGVSVTVSAPVRLTSDHASAAQCCSNNRDRGDRRRRDHLSGKAGSNDRAPPCRSAHLRYLGFRQFERPGMRESLGIRIVRHVLKEVADPAIEAATIRFLRVWPCARGRRYVALGCWGDIFESRGRPRRETPSTRDRASIEGNVRALRSTRSTTVFRHVVVWRSTLPRLDTYPWV